MEIFKPPNILYIRGVFLSEINRSFEQMVDDKFARYDETSNFVDSETESVGTAVEMPKVFTGIGAWPRDTNFKCATCFGECDTLVFIPKYMERARTGNGFEWGVTQIPFNSFPCAAYHIEWFMKNDSQYKILLAKLYEIYNNEKIIEVISALPPWRLREVNGDLTRSQYMQINDDNNNRFNNTRSEYNHMTRNNSESHIAHEYDNDEYEAFDDDTENTVLEE